MRIIFKLVQNTIYGDINLCEDDFNVEVYLIDEELNLHKKGFIYDMNKDSINKLGFILKNKFNMSVEIMWNEITSECI